MRTWPDLAPAATRAVVLLSGPARSWPALLALAASALLLGCGAGAADRDANGTASSSATSVDVRVVVPTRRDMTRSVELPASVEAFETATLLSRVSGYLGSVEVDIGDAVTAGQRIARVEVPEMVDELRETEAEIEAKRAQHTAAEAEIARARTELELREITHERIQAVQGDEPDLVAPQTLDEARAKRDLARAAVLVGQSRAKEIESTIKRVEASAQRLRTMIGFSEIRAPFDGVVTQRHVDPGILVQAETSSRAVQRIVTLARFDRVRIRVDVPEREVPFVQVGDPATIAIDSMPGRPFAGEVTRFAGALDPSTRTMRAEMHLPNPGRVLRPGMYGRARLTLDTRSGVLTIPAEALRVDGEGTFVYAVVGGLVRRLEVRTSVGDGAILEVSEGLAGDERIVVTARGPIADGTSVNVEGLRPEVRH